MTQRKGEYVSRFDWRCPKCESIWSKTQKECPICSFFKRYAKEPMMPFVVVGKLWLRAQEGGNAGDDWGICQDRKRGCLSDLHLDNMVAKHFKAERIRPSGDRYIGKVRITIESLEEE